MLRVWEERNEHLPGPAYGVRSKEIAMRHGHEATGTRQKGRVLLALLVALLVTSAVPGYAGRGRHGGHGGHHFGRGGHGFIGPRLGVSIWPYWDPYWTPYAAPPVVVAP